MKRAFNSCQLKLKTLQLSIEEKKNPETLNNSAVISLDKSLKSKISFDINEIRQEIKDRENRHLAREKEFDEIFSDFTEKKALSEVYIETLENNQEVAETSTPESSIFFKCFKKFCFFL